MDTCHGPGFRATRGRVAAVMPSPSRGVRQHDTDTDETCSFPNAPRPKPTEVLVLSEIPGVLDALKAFVPAHEALFFQHTPVTVTTATLMCFEVVIADPGSFAKVADRCTEGSLRWTQLTFAGVDKLICGSTHREYVCTRLGGVFGEAIAEFCVMHVLSHLRDMDVNANNQCTKVWGRNLESQKQKFIKQKNVRDLTIGILGFGDIGQRVGEVFSAFGCRIWTVRRRGGAGIGGGAMWDVSNDFTPKFVDKAFGMNSEIVNFFAGCDVVINLLPSTRETVGFLNKNTLRKFRDGCLLINVGRGDIFGATDYEAEETICAALDAPGGVEKCVLDVFTTEPLPQHSPLWAHPKVKVTPHVAAVTHVNDVAAVFKENLASFRDGREMKHVVDWDKGY